MLTVLLFLPWMGLSVLFPTNMHVAEMEQADHYEFDQLEAPTSHTSLGAAETSYSGSAAVCQPLKNVAITSI